MRRQTDNRRIRPMRGPRKTMAVAAIWALIAASTLALLMFVGGSSLETVVSQAINEAITRANEQPNGYIRNPRQ